MLRSLRSIRRLHVGNRRLGSPLTSSAENHVVNTLHNNSTPSNLAALTLNKNYVTKVALKENFNKTKPAPNIDLLINELDRQIIQTGRINKRELGKVLDAVVQKGSLTSTQALLLIRCCGDYLASESYDSRKSMTETIWNTIKELGIPLDVSHYNALLLVYLQNEVDFSPVDILMEMKNQNIEPNRVTFQRSIEQYCNKGDIAGATKILEHMRQKDLPVNENIFNSLIKGHSVAGDIASAINILEIMNQAGIKPTSNTYREVLCAHAQLGDINAIRNTLKECEENDILLSDKILLHVIYTLGVNQQKEHIDEMITLLNKGAAYNRVTLPYIYKLIDKKHEDVAYKLYETLQIISERQLNTDGQFFVKKLVCANVDVNDIIKYCDLMKRPSNDFFHLVVKTALVENLPNLAISLMKAWRERGGEIRENYFFPIFCGYGRVHNLQGVLDTLKIMINDFNITPLFSSISDYVVPYMVESPIENYNILRNHGLQFRCAAQAVLIHLLERNEMREALKFIQKTNLLNSATADIEWIKAFCNTKDILSFVEFLHHQQAMMAIESSKNLDESVLEKITSPKQYISKMVVKVVKRLRDEDKHILPDFFKSLLSKGLSINDSAIEEIKTHLENNLTPEIDEILTKLSSIELVPSPLEREFRRQSTEDHKPETPLDFKLELAKNYAEKNDEVKLEEVLQELEQMNVSYNLSFCTAMFKHYVKNYKIEGADKWFNQILKINPNYQINKLNALRYALTYVNAYRPAEDALKILDIPINNFNIPTDVLVKKLLQNVGVAYPDRVEDFFNKLKNNNIFTTVTTETLSPIIKAEIDREDLEKALEKFKWAVDTYKLTPMKNSLYQKFIEKEDAQVLQTITELDTKIHGRSSALFELALAFLQCNRPRQARKILETTRLRLSRERILRVAEEMLKKSTTRLEEFIQLIDGFFFNIEELYCLLLGAYGQKGHWEKCLALWTQMQEDNIQPSNKFMKDLEAILRKNGQDVPFSRSTGSDEEESFSEMFHNALEAQNFALAEDIIRNEPKEARGAHLEKLIETYIANGDIEKAIHYLNELFSHENNLISSYRDMIEITLTKLAEIDDFTSIMSLLEKVNKLATKQDLEFKVQVLGQSVQEAYIQSGKFDKFLDHIDSEIDSCNNNNKQNAISSLMKNFYTVEELFKHPELEEKFKKVSYKFLEKNIFTPINSLWFYEFLKDKPEADEIWNQHLKDSRKFHPTYILHTIRATNTWDKFLPFVDKLCECNIPTMEKRKIFASFIRVLTDSDLPNKYTLAYECLQRTAKFININHFDHRIIKTIMENVENGKTLESLTAVKETATQ